jgi:hypothetical protein
MGRGETLACRRNGWLRRTAFCHLVAAGHRLRPADIRGDQSRHSFDLNAKTTVDALKIFETALRLTLREITDQGLRIVIVLQTRILFRSEEGA